MQKSNIRSFRFNDETLHMIEKFEGGNLTEKFENMVIHCYKKAPELEKYHENLLERIEHQKKRLKELTAFTDDLSNLNQAHTGLINSIIDVRIKAKKMYGGKAYEEINKKPPSLNKNKEDEKDESKRNTA